MCMHDSDHTHLCVCMTVTTHTLCMHDSDHTSVSLRVKITIIIVYHTENILQGLFPRFGQLILTEEFQKRKPRKSEGEFLNKDTQCC